MSLESIIQQESDSLAGKIVDLRRFVQSSDFARVNAVQRKQLPALLRAMLEQQNCLRLLQEDFSPPVTEEDANAELWEELAVDPEGEDEDADVDDETLDDQADAALDRLDEMKSEFEDL